MSVDEQALQAAIPVGSNMANADLVRAIIEAYESARSAEPVACLTAAEQKAQGARCSCRGVDDYCPCQNVPDAETKKAGSAREDTAG